MNRLIIIGNGFDLAHGMKTGFNDFISNYFCNAINHFFDNREYSDILFEIKFKESYKYLIPKPKPVTTETVYEQLEYLRTHRDINLKFSSLLLERIYSKASILKWVDIEVEFFNGLLDTKNATHGENQEKEIKIINEQLDLIKDKLIEYLIQQEKIFKNTSIKNQLAASFREEIKKQQIVTIDIEKDILPNNLFFLNFNYTKTFEEYFEICKKHIPSTYNYIHGNLSSEYGKPIFGFGDELNKKYLEFEDEKNNDLFKHIKSFEYLQTKNYYELTRFIESDDFQIHIYGHSCGISDRTLLNQIFEHTNCKSIKIFYHKINEELNDFTDKTYEISRHFKDKTLLRKKLVPLELSRPMSQPKFN